MSLKGSGWKEAFRLRAALEMAEEALRSHHWQEPGASCEDADDARAALRTFDGETAPHLKVRAKERAGTEVVIATAQVTGPSGSSAPTRPELHDREPQA